MSVLCCSLVLLLINTVNGQCYGVSVTGASMEPSINGYYTLFEDVRCNGYNVWVQQENNEYAVNYITFLTKDYYTVNGTAIGGWAIGPSLCRTLSYVFALNQVSGYVSVPYDLPYTWEELNPQTGLFVEDTDIQVFCSMNLSAGAIVGIVIGCVCILIMILTIIACICSHHKKPRSRRRTQYPDTATTVTTVYTTPAGYTTNNQPAMFIAPPTYDTSAPPGYYEYIPTNMATATKQPLDQSQSPGVQVVSTNGGQ